MKHWAGNQALSYFDERMKSSGYGKDMSAYALEDYTVPRHVMVKM